MFLTFRMKETIEASLTGWISVGIIIIRVKLRKSECVSKGGAPRLYDFY